MGAAAPRRRLPPRGRDHRRGGCWAGRLLVVPALLAALVWLAGAPAPWLTVTLVAGLLVFGAVFAVNSALHSYLILHFSMAARVTMDVGFYYMANAAVPQRDLVVMDRPD